MEQWIKTVFVDKLFYDPEAALKEDKEQVQKPVEKIQSRWTCGDPILLLALAYEFVYPKLSYRLS